MKTNRIPALLLLLSAALLCSAGCAKKNQVKPNVETEVLESQETEPRQTESLAPDAIGDYEETELEL